MVAPEVMPGRDIIVEEGNGLYRVAVSSIVVRFRHWFVFRCFVYPDVTGMELSRRVGYLQVPHAVVGRFNVPKEAINQGARVRANASLNSVSKPMKRLVKLLFPVRPTASRRNFH